MTGVKKVSICGIGIALYVALSMMVKIPLVGHASLDLGYIVLAVYCYHFGSVSGAVVGGVGCMLVSMLTTGWFPPGWITGNIFIGLVVGMVGKKRDISPEKRVGIVILSVFIGIFVIKTVIECCLYSIPFAVKLPKSAVVFFTDAVVMSVGTLLAPKLRRGATDES